MTNYIKDDDEFLRRIAAHIHKIAVLPDDHSGIHYPHDDSKIDFMSTLTNSIIVGLDVIILGMVGNFKNSKELQLKYLNHVISMTQNYMRQLHK